MCRLSAIIQKPTNKRLDSSTISVLIEMMKDNSSTTNKDGFGIAVINNDSVEIFKRGKEFGDFIGNADFIKFMWKNFTGTEILMGHVRLASVGKGQLSDENSHPFVDGHLVLAHNGHFPDFEEVAKKNKITATVDSDVFLKLLSKEIGKNPLTGEAIQKVVDEIEGAFAFIIYDELIPETLWLAVGSNSLTVYENSQMFLVNTDGNLEKVINEALWKLAINTRFFEPVKATKLITGTLYTLTSKELKKIQDLKLNPKIVVSNTYNRGTVIDDDYMGMYGGRFNNYKDNNSVLIDWKDYNKPEKNIKYFTDRWNIPLNVLELLLDQLPLVPSEIVDLDDFWIEVLDDFMAWLEEQKYITKETMLSKKIVWENIVGLFKETDPKITINEVSDELLDNFDGENDEVIFLSPYFMNTIDVLSKIHTALSGKINTTANTGEKCTQLTLVPSLDNITL